MENKCSGRGGRLSFVLDEEMADALRRYHRRISRELARAGWDPLSRSDVARAVVERFLRDHIGTDGR
jgi:hypothetical protein